MASLDDSTVPITTTASTLHEKRSRSDTANQIATPATAMYERRALRAVIEQHAEHQHRSEKEQAKTQISPM